ncbi:ferritin-like domain-containing protein [Microdochium trichocladiopsis]|uniref:Ferritin-like domain-containing protein n=1 Tax=Microdochium trichocladiopsis TaxID=1682393 RepID=A0A9P8XXL7_9PEZI|nr:ferritin-like domain-containing protein [Microdochium trichocladiopsis]KAH7024455.1 ferritin-like domain-containing protein [Microdochium trichocladiopsis]
MHYLQTGLSLALVGAAAAVPLSSRGYASPSKGPSDADILNYALTLEHLEDVFYRDGLAKFSEKDFADAGYDAVVYKNIQTVSSDEATHVSFLTTALQAAGATPVKACTYNFAYTDVKTFLATASVLEGVGVSAYLGAAADIMSKDYLTAAGSILTVEARHSSYIRAKINEVPFPQPFDAPLTLDEVYSLASQFIVSCPPENPKLPVKAFPKLTLETKPPIKTGDTVTVLTPGYKIETHGEKLYAAFIAVTGPTFVEAKPVNGGYSFVIPKGFAGQTYVVLTGCDKEVTDDTVVAGPAIIEIASY